MTTPSPLRPLKPALIGAALIGAALTLSGLVAGPSAATGQTMPENPAYPDLSAADNARIAWWIDARYGMFLHWGCLQRARGRDQLGPQGPQAA